MVPNYFGGLFLCCDLYGGLAPYTCVGPLQGAVQGAVRRGQINETFSVFFDI
jgi:hypothetical protein